MTRFLAAGILVFGVFGAIGCGDDSSSGASFDEVFESGLLDYQGMFSPANVDEIAGVKTHNFDTDPLDEARGPICIEGEDYFVSTREGSSNDLMIFLQGGGGCWDGVDSCFKVPTPFLQFGVLSATDMANPLKDFDVVYVPYCDGSLFQGNIDRTINGNVSYQRGLQNVTAALDIALSEFPSPDRIVLTGISGGAFGTISVMPMVRAYYPDTEILVLNDSGLGVAKSEETGFVDFLLEEFNSTRFIPESCIDCTGNGHITRLLEWQLDNDPNLSMPCSAI